MPIKSRPPLYITYTQIKQRCYNKNHDMYKYYWWRWISVCDERLQWYKFFYNSIIDNIWNKPSDKHTLDRIDNNKSYTPDNIKRSTREEQFNNRSDNVVIEWKTLAQWARYYSIWRSSFHKMYIKLWFNGACKYYENRSKNTCNWLSYSDIARKSNVSREAIYYHKRLWKTIEQIYNYFLW